MRIVLFGIRPGTNPVREASVSHLAGSGPSLAASGAVDLSIAFHSAVRHAASSVSYTHLTLPTTPYV